MARKSEIYQQMKVAILHGKADLSAEQRLDIYHQVIKKKTNKAKSELENWAQKVSIDSHKTSIDEINKLKKNGFSEGIIFEASVIAAFSAAELRLATGINLLKKIK